MSLLLLRQSARRAFRPASISSRRHASRIEIPVAAPPFPVIESCPAPTCQCRETPSDLDIDRETSLSGTMAAYGEQILISTGRDDWKSRIEDDSDAILVRQLRKFLLRGGKYVDPYHNVLITNSSFSPSRPPHNDALPASAFLLPSFQYIPFIETEDSGLETFIKAYILPQKLHNQHDRLSRAEQNILLREATLQKQFPGARKIDEILVLICGHGGRDDRCGKLGPILRDEFEEKLTRQNIAVLRDAPVDVAEERNSDLEGYVPTARVGLISHIGGHKWAGNVIVYIPPSFASNALSGKGIWYGRVGPEHVEGIVGKTILDGKVIKDIFRGGIDHNGEILRL